MSHAYKKSFILLLFLLCVPLLGSAPAQDIQNENKFYIGYNDSDPVFGVPDI